MTTTTSSQFTILVVEDNPADVRLFREAFKQSKVHSALTVARDGVEAMALLRAPGDQSAARKPDLIFLDLNLPRKDGRQVLAEVKQDAALRRIPVVVFTTSRAESDIITTYDLHANCYIVKPSNLDQYFEVILSAESFWLSIATRAPQ